MNAKKVLLSMCILAILISGMIDMHFLLTGVKTNGVIIQLMKGRRNTVLAVVRYRAEGLGNVTSTVNSEGHKIGDKVMLIYAAKDPFNTVNNYRPARFAIPIVCFIASGILLYFVWGRMK